LKFASLLTPRRDRWRSRRDVPAEGPAPFFSIVLAVRNGAATLERCLDSVFAQTFQDYELIVIDGASTDGTQDIIARHAERIRYWVSEPDRGIYQAWNKALAQARGTWVFFIGADDRFHDAQVLEHVAGPLAEAEGEYRVVYGEIIRVDAAGKIISRKGAPWPSLRDRFRRYMALPHQGVFHHASLFERRGLFDERYRISGDYELLLRELVGNEALFLERTVVDMGVGGISDRPEHRGTMYLESYRARRHHGLLSTAEWFKLSVPLERARLRAWLTRRFGERAAHRIVDIYRFVMRKPRRRQAAR
jgi:glycosyltransferase involved in cell wall biosynthesis